MFGYNLIYIFLATNTIETPKGIVTFGIKDFSRRKSFVKIEFIKSGTSSMGASLFLSPPVNLSENLFKTAGGNKIVLK
jgi:hypothetical protein